MRLFETVFELVKLPLLVAKDTVLAIPDSSMLMEPFEDTKNQCRKLDELLRRRP